MQELGRTGVEVSRIALGCMRMDALSTQEASRLLATALEEGMTFFDHADIYGGGQSEIRFATAMKAEKVARDKVFLQSKCGIRKGYFDFSKEHILKAVEGSLQRLGVDELDLLALHRPDALMEAQEVAEAFYELKKSGKVRYFGVSNQNCYQMELLQSYLEEPLVVNQLQLSPAHTPLIDAGLHVNMKEEAGIPRAEGLVEYCQLKRITIQAWSPFLISLSEGLFFGHPAYQALNDRLYKYARRYQVSPEAVVVAWILRHPAKMQTLVGTTNPDRLRKIAAARQVYLTRQEWYDIYQSAGNRLP